MTREEALKAITAFVENYACGSDLDGLREAIEALKEQRPRGEWIMHKNFEVRFYECSNCNHTQGYLTDFCDTCGADMRKEGEVSKWQVMMIPQ